MRWQFWGPCGSATRGTVGLDESAHQAPAARLGREGKGVSSQQGQTSKGSRGRPLQQRGCEAAWMLGS
jgi:hypothetical protein